MSIELKKGWALLVNDYYSCDRYSRFGAGVLSEDPLLLAIVLTVVVCADVVVAKNATISRIMRGRILCVYSTVRRISALNQ